mgnify:FL=1
MNQEESNNLNQSEGLDLGRLLRIILLQSKIIAVFTLTALAIGLSSYFLSDKTFKISSLLQVHSPNKTYDPRQTLNVDFFNAPETNLNNLVTLYSSRSNTLNLINNLNLHIEVENIEAEETFKIKTFEIETNKNIEKKIFYAEVQNDYFNLLDEEKNFLLSSQNGKYFKSDDFEIEINFSNLKSEKLIKIIYRNPSSLFNRYKNMIRVENLANISNSWIQEGLLESSLITKDINQGMEILNTANEIFIKDSIKVETEKARTSIVFIDSQLTSLEEILNLRKNELKSFKQENKSLNVNLEVESIIGLISDVEQKINKVDLELLQAEINFTTDNPLYLNLKIQRDALEIQKSGIEQKIESLPVAQQEYIDLFRNLEVSEGLYSELLSRKLNFSLIEASSIGNIRIVDKAFVEMLVGPRLSLVVIFTLAAFFAGILFAIFRGAFFMSLSNPAELQDAGINENIIGVIPHLDDTDKVSEDVKFKQSIETSILNIETIISSANDVGDINCSNIVITSPTPENGKSFISRGVTDGLSRIGHKVLLIDADLKRGAQHKFFNKELLSLDVFQKISTENIESLKIQNNLYFLPRIKNIKNTFEHLYSNLFLEKIKEFEDFFDYIIIDTAPALSVSDTGLLMSSSDLNFLVIRHQLNKINEIRQTKQIINQIGRSFDGIIYNDYQKPESYFGYYDLYGDYSYRYYAERYLYKDYYSEKDE